MNSSKKPTKDQTREETFVVVLGPMHIDIKVQIYEWLITAFLYEDPECPIDKAMNQRTLHPIRLEARRIKLLKELRIKINHIGLSNIYYLVN